MVLISMSTSYQGSGTTDLVRSVLDTARAEGVKVIPTCPYVSWWINEYQPGYEDLVATA